MSCSRTKHSDAREARTKRLRYDYLERVVPKIRKKLAQYAISKHSFLLLLINIICNYKAWFPLMKFKISKILNFRNPDSKTCKIIFILSLNGH